MHDPCKAKVTSDYDFPSWNLNTAVVTPLCEVNAAAAAAELNAVAVDAADDFVVGVAAAAAAAAAINSADVDAADDFVVDVAAAADADAAA